MAYVGTPRRGSDPVRSLASVLQGEASSRAGQTAVANVILNRAEVNYSRYGGDALSQAFAPRQFQGQSTPSPQALEIAQQTLDGTLPRTLTNSLNYAAPTYSGPGATTAGWALRALNSGQGVNIGGNYFFVNDRGGTPNYDPSAIGAPMNTNNPTGVTGSSGLVTDPNPRISADGKTAEATWTEGDLAVNEPLNDSPLGVIKIRPQNSTPPTSGSAGTGNGGAGGGTGAVNGGSAAGGSFTVPQAIDTQTRGNASNTSALNKQSQQNTEALNKTSTANTKAGIDTATGLYKSATGSLSDYFVRLVFIVVGIIALVGALMLFSKPKQLIQQVAKAAL